jgi:hypothetical protein
MVKDEPNRQRVTLPWQRATLSSQRAPTWPGTSQARQPAPPRWPKTRAAIWLRPLATRRAPSTGALRGKRRRPDGRRAASRCHGQQLQTQDAALPRSGRHSSRMDDRNVTYHKQPGKIKRSPGPQVEWDSEGAEGWQARNLRARGSRSLRRPGRDQGRATRAKAGAS